MDSDWILVVHCTKVEVLCSFMPSLGNFCSCSCVDINLKLNMCQITTGTMFGLVNSVPNRIIRGGKFGLKISITFIEHWWDLKYKHSNVFKCPMNGKTVSIVLKYQHYIFVTLL